MSNTTRVLEHAGTPRPTAPLPQPAVDALSRLDRAFLPLPIVRAVTRYEVAALRYDELIARPASQLSPAEVDAIGDAQQTMADEFGVLAEAGRTDLLAPLWTADRYRGASARCSAASLDGNIEECLRAQDEMGHRLCQLRDAGRLDLIEVIR